MAKKLKYICKAEGQNLHPDYVGTEYYQYEFEGNLITIITKNGKVWQFGYPGDRDKEGLREKFEASIDYQAICYLFDKIKI